jgi:hypothetical protein
MRFAAPVISGLHGGRNCAMLPWFIWKGFYKKPLGMDESFMKHGRDARATADAKV